MPISGDEFERYKNPLHYILEFLKKNKGVAFTAEEIADRVEIDRGVIVTTLNLVPLGELIAISRRTEFPIKAVTIKNVTYYKCNEKYRE